MMGKERATSGDAPPQMGVILLALAGILMLSLAVCALVIENAVSLRGRAAVSDHVQSDGTAENLIPIVEEPWMAHGVLHIRGALLRLNQPVGAVNMRVGLIPLDARTGADVQDEAIVLNTQMERRFDHAAEYGCDDHCGFSAAVRVKRLPEQAEMYRVVILDETGGEKRMIGTDMVIMPTEGGAAFERRPQGEKEEQDAL